MPNFCTLLQFNFLSTKDDEFKALSVHTMNENAGVSV